MVKNELMSAAAARSEPPEAVLGLCDERQPGRAMRSGVAGAMVFGEHAATDVFVDLDTERMRDLLGDAHTAAMPGSDFHKAGFFRRCAAVIKISRESSSSDTSRAMPM